MCSTAADFALCNNFAIGVDSQHIVPGVYSLRYCKGECLGFWVYSVKFVTKCLIIWFTSYNMFCSIGMGLMHLGGASPSVCDLPHHLCLQVIGLLSRIVHFVLLCLVPLFSPKWILTFVHFHWCFWALELLCLGCNRKHYISVNYRVASSFLKQTRMMPNSTNSFVIKWPFSCIVFRSRFDYPTLPLNSFSLDFSSSFGSECSISKCLSVFSWKHLTPATTRFLVQNVSFRAIFRDFLGSNSGLPFVTEAGWKFSSSEDFFPASSSFEMTGFAIALSRCHIVLFLGRFTVNLLCIVG